MSVIQIIAAALAFWGYGGVEVEFVMEEFAPGVSAIAGGAPNGTGCYVKVVPSAWARWADGTKVKVVAHELFHCLTVSSWHDHDDPESIMGPGFGTFARPHHWQALRDARPSFPFRTVVGGIAH